MKLLKRTLAMLLALTMVLGMVPFAAFAEETTEGTDGTSSVPTHMATKPADGRVTGQPFNIDPTVSRNYRIPGLVNHNGTLIAVADARYDQEYDGGGIDIVVSRSTDGNIWNYTFPAYLGDNGNIHAKDSSTLMDPLIISDGTKLYLFYDMFPAGYSLAGGDNTTHSFWSGETGFDASGRLRLGETYDSRTESDWSYYLEGGVIKNSAGEATEYTVDDWFNVYEGDTYVSNLFFDEGSPFYAYPTSYIAMQTSSDNGNSWTTPQLLNIKRSGAWWEVLGPGSGLVTLDGNLAFTAYDGSNIFLIYGKENSWKSVQTSAANNESSIIQLADGTIRAFVKNNNNQICYVDFTKTETGYTAGSQVNTGLTSQSSCMVSSMLYSKTLDGKDVVLVTCPTSTGGRYHGKMHMFTLNNDANKTMNYVGAHEINGANDFFAYSEMAELNNGKIALLYEDDCKYYNWTDGAEHASHISYTEIDLETALNVEFDVDYDVFVWNADNSAGEIRVPTTAGVNHVHVQPKTLDTMTVDYSAYDMVLCKDEEDNCTAEFNCTNVHTGTAIVELALTDTLKSAADVKGFVVEADDGSITSVFDVENDGTHVTFEAPHFSVVGIAAMTEEEIAQKNAVEVTLYSDETKTITLEGVAATGNHTSDAADVAWRDISSAKTYTLAGIGTEDTNYTADTIKLDDCLYTFTASGNGYIVQSKSNPSLYLNTVQNSAGIPNGTASRVVTVTPLTDGSGTFYLHNTYDNGNTGYLYFWRDGKNRFDRNGSVHDSCKFYLYRPAAENETSSTEIPGYVNVTTVANGEYLIAALYNNTYYVLRPSTETENNDTAKRSHVARVTDQTVTEGVVATEITITGKTEDTTSVTIGNTLYNITVKMDAVDITLNAGENKTVTLDGVNYTTSSISKQPQATIATIGSVVGSPIKGKELRAVTSVDDLSADKEYLLVNNRAANGTPNYCVLTNRNNDGGLDMTGPVDANSAELWKITAVTGGHTITRGNSYVTFSSGAASVTETETVVTLERVNEGWLISLGESYLSDHGGNARNYTKGYNTRDDGGNYWTIYEVASIDVGYTTDVTFTGVAGGTTEAVVGHTKFNITVIPAERKQIDVKLHVGESKTYTDETGNYKASASIEDATIARMDVTGTDASAKHMAEVTENTAFVEGKKYLIVSMRDTANGLLTANPYTATISWSGLAINGLNTNGAVSADSTDVWSVIPCGNDKYYVKYGDQYLTFANGATSTASLTDTPTELELIHDDAGFWKIKNGEAYLSNVGGFVNNYFGASGFTFDEGGKWKIYEVTGGNATTEITFTGAAEGKTQAIVGNTQYNITVIAPEERDITLHIGASEIFTIEDFAYTMADVKTHPDTAYAALDAVRAVPSLVPVTAIESGKQYLIVNKSTGDVLTDTVVSASGQWGARTGLNTTGKASAYSAELWTITGADGSYTVAQNGKYLVVAGFHADMSTDAANLTLAYTDSGWTIYDNTTYQALGHDGPGYYLSDNVGDAYTQDAMGTNKDDNTARYWDIYEIDPHGATEVMFTGAAKGNTTAVIGHVTFNITVVQPDPIVQNITLYKDATGTFVIEGASYSADNVTTEPADTSAKLVSIVGTSNPAHNEPVEVKEIESGKQYIIVNNRAQKPLTNTPFTSNANRLTLTGTKEQMAEAAIWTIEQTDGGYTVKDANGNYLTLDSGTANVVASTQTIALEKNGATWTIGQNGAYLNDHGGGGDDAAGYESGDAQTDGGSQWKIYEIVTVGATSSTEVTFQGVTPGTTTTAVIGHVTYNITVKERDVRDITLYVGVTLNDSIDGYSYDNTVSKQPNNDYAFIHSVTTENGDTKVVFSGVSETPEGQPTVATVGHVTYNITVKSLRSGDDIPGFNCVIGEGEYASGAGVKEDLSGKEVKSLRITEGASFDLGVDITDYSTIAWNTTDSNVATVSPDGRITAHVEGRTLITATVTTESGAEETIAVHVTVVPSMVEGYSEDEISHVVYYIDQVHKVDPYYTMFLSSENTTGTVADHTMVMVSEGEVLCFERPKSAAFALVWTADPWDNHALTYMAATGTLGEYHPLQVTNGVLGSGTTAEGVKYYKGSTAYTNIITHGSGAGASWQAAMDAFLEYNVHVGEDIWKEFGCDGAMSMSRTVNDAYPHTATSLSFVAEKLPEVKKTVNGVLGISGKKVDWKLYQDGMYAEVDEYIYFDITVTQDVPHSWKYDDNGDVRTDDRGQLAALEYLGTANLIDRLMRPVTDVNGNITYEPVTVMANPPYFYSKDLDEQDGDRSGNGIENDDGYIVDVDLQTNTQDIATALNAGWTQEEIDAGQRTLTYNVVYKIQETDANSTLTNGVALDYEYSSTYSSGTDEAIGTAQAEMHILGASLGDLVVDFGMPVVLSNLTTANRADEFDEDATNAAIGGARYGHVDIEQTAQDDPATADVNEARWSVTYTPDKILQTYDVVYLMNENDVLVNYFRVYPATTVFYEEGFLLEQYKEGKWIGSNNGWNVTSAVTSAGNQVYEAMGDKTHSFGYDPIYTAVKEDGTPYHIEGSAGSYISADAIGANTSFTFTGTGFDLYANCAADSGYVAVTVRKHNADDSRTTVKLYTVNTMVKAGNTTATAGQKDNEYHMPIISEQGLDHATYTVEIRKIMKTEKPVKIDGVRIYNTMADSTIYEDDMEDKPVFFELRDYVLKALNISYSEQYDTLSGMAGQVYSQLVDAENPEDVAFVLGTGAKTDSYDKTVTTTTKYEDGGTSVEVVVTGVYREYEEDGVTVKKETTREISRSTTYYDANGQVSLEFNTTPVVETTKEETIGENKGSSSTTAQDLLDNGPKNELFLYTDQSLTFKVTTKRMMQLGLKAPAGVSTSYKIEVNGTTVKEEAMNTSVDMFYALNDAPTESATEYLITVTNTGSGILSVTKLKICDDPNAKFVPLTVEDIEQVLLAAGYPADEEAPVDPSTPEESKPQETTPEVTTPEESKPEESKPQETTPEESEPADTGCAKDKTCILSKFSDIVTNEWYHDGVHFCVDQGLMNGMGEGIFAPNDPTTRAQLVTMLYRLMGNPKAEGKTEPFTDVAEGEWYYDAIVWAYSENVVKGISETEFAPNANVTREQVATILHRFLITPEGTGNLDSFSDAAEVSTYAKDALVWAVGAGLINGVEQSDGTVLLDPTGIATRAQIATILYRHLENA